MSPSAADHILRKLKERASENLSREEISAIVHEAVRDMQAPDGGTAAQLRGELEALAHYIEDAKREIAAIQSNDGAHIPSATDELDAVIGATQDATNKIMNACDQVMEIAGTLPQEANEKLMNIVTGIYEACNFQDITGQRITKVVRTLRHIEEWVNRLVGVFGTAAGASGTAKAATVGDEKSLLNGPQLPGNAIDQDEIDKLMASFDAPSSSN